MSQHDFDITTADANTGATMRTAINAALQAQAGNSSGATEPTTKYPYQLWADTTSGFLKMRNAANSAWITGPRLADFSLDITRTVSGVAHTINNGHATTPNGADITFGGGAPNNTTQYYLRGNDTSTTRFYIYSNGNMQNSNNSYGAISDETLKQDIVDAGSQWDDIKAVRLRKYRFKADPDGPLQIGVVAQEIELVSPGLVEENEEGVKGVKYSILYLKAVKALQEAMARIEVLESQMAALCK